MDLLMIILNIVAITYALYCFRVIKKHRKKIEENKDVLGDNEQLQNEIAKESKKIIVTIIVNMILLILSNIIKIISTLYGE